MLNKASRGHLGVLGKDNPVTPLRQSVKERDELKLVGAKYVNSQIVSLAYWRLRETYIRIKKDKW
ncbi:hypothetical protein GCM10007932_42580 [Vibrio penaeicida]|uniref:Uncharacterized protein n=1 Tax=Vibrio penaeicida TaxID=104609 RepID=A0AAV5NY37_9VIBR|nr:hypothetical protein GCM10007932_42580 [Vibrio penaeicida]